MKYKIQQKLHIGIVQNNQKEEFMRRHKKQRPTHLHTQDSHKNAKLEAIIYTQMTWCRPMQVLCMLPQSLSSYALCSF